MKKTIPLVAAAAATSLLSGCNWTVINPSGYVAKQQSNLLLFSVYVMLLIIVPVIIATLYYAWKYRASANAEYDPDFYHSNKLEVLIWGAPIAIIIVLALVTWGSSHLLDPYRPLARIDKDTAIAGVNENLGAVKRMTAAVIDPGRVNEKTVDVKPLRVEVAALDWKWLFIYPDYGIATVNELAAPVNTPIDFTLTSVSAMNSFYIPALAGQVYAMPGMRTKLHAVMNEEGVYKGFSANYTGWGFSQMHFDFTGMSQQGFDQWVEQVRQSPQTLDRKEYMALDVADQTNERGFVQYFGTRHYANVEVDMYHAILNLCARPGSMCMDEMMAIDTAGGAGVDSLDNLKRLRYDSRRTLKTQLDLVKFSGIIPGTFVCTPDSTTADLVRSPFDTAKNEDAGAHGAVSTQKISANTGAVSTAL
ncbi:ubiquinol oxidase subunit II [Lampropedia puyangensis]|uniref:Ubiquinol oxidase subunit 2 n=1 Tax=Lampropedia puyangensis TaxID=1330072 RepID=A0A4V4GRZ7_9BURK|nr:ubiquinol oxidase subunit II [Lampropedia puyangensis]THU02546.1 ubiquinol oxidase subunit II [Lampropedia puyangensis]